MPQGKRLCVNADATGGSLAVEVLDGAGRVVDCNDRALRDITIGLGGPTYDLARLTDWLAWRDEINAAR